MEQFAVAAVRRASSLSSSSSSSSSSSVAAPAPAPAATTQFDVCHDNCYHEEVFTSSSSSSSPAPAAVAPEIDDCYDNNNDGYDYDGGSPPHEGEGNNGYQEGDHNDEESIVMQHRLQRFGQAAEEGLISP